MKSLRFVFCEGNTLGNDLIVLFMYVLTAYYIFLHQFFFIHKQFLFLSRDLIVSLLTLNHEIKGLPLITGIIKKDIQVIAYSVSLSAIGIMYP